MRQCQFVNTGVLYLFGDTAVFINIIQVKGPPQFLCHRTSKQNRQADYKVLPKHTYYTWLEDKTKCNILTWDCQLD